MSIPQLSDFEPKGAACTAFGVLHEGGFPQRALVVTGPDGVVRYSYQAPTPARAARALSCCARASPRPRPDTNLPSGLASAKLRWFGIRDKNDPPGTRRSATGRVSQPDGRSIGVESI